MHSRWICWRMIVSDKLEIVANIKYFSNIILSIGLFVKV